MPKRKPGLGPDGRPIIEKLGYVSDKETAVDWAMLYVPALSRPAPFVPKPCAASGCEGMTFSRSSGPWRPSHGKADRLNGKPGRGYDSRSPLRRDVEYLGLAGALGWVATDDGSVIDLEAARKALGGSETTVERPTAAEEVRPVPRPWRRCWTRSRSRLNVRTCSRRLRLVHFDHRRSMSTEVRMRTVLGWIFLTFGGFTVLSSFTADDKLGAVLFGLACLLVGFRLVWRGKKSGVQSNASAATPSAQHRAPTPPQPESASMPHHPASPNGKKAEPWGRTSNFQPINGEYHVPNNNFREILRRHGQQLREDGVEIRDAEAQVVADPSNPYDENAVAVWIADKHVGYLPRDSAAAYSGPLQDLAEQGLVLTIPANIRVYPEGSRISANVAVILPEARSVQSFNELPEEPHEVLPRGRAIQVTGEADHMDVLSKYTSDADRDLAVTLHVVEEEIRTGPRRLVEVRLDGHKVGMLTKVTSDQVVDLLDHVTTAGKVPVCRAVLKGSALKAEVTLYLARSHEVSQRWVDAVAERAGERGGR